MYDLLLGVNASSFEEYEVEAKVTKILDFETAAATLVRSVFPQNQKHYEGNYKKMDYRQSILRLLRKDQI